MSAQPERGSQKGFSLVELMIALVLGLVLLAGVWQIFTSSSQAYRLTDSLSQIQENMRFAMGRIQYEARMAGFAGCLIGDPLNHLNPGDSDYSNYIHANWPVFGWEADGTGVGAAYSNSDFNSSNTNLTNKAQDGDNQYEIPALLDGAIPGSDVVVLTSARPANIVLQGNTPANAAALNAAGQTGIPAGQILLVVSSTCTNGDIFQNGNNANANSLVKNAGGNVSPGNVNPNGGFSTTYDDNASVYLYGSNAYFVGIGTSGQPSLFVQSMDRPDTAAVELVEGVENLQVLYGVGRQGSGVRAVVNYVTASELDVTGLPNDETETPDWSDVVSVRLALLFRSDDGVEVEVDDGPYNLLGVQVNTENDQRARIVGIATVGIRNRLQ